MTKHQQVVPSRDLIARVERTLKMGNSKQWKSVHRGYTPAERWVVQFEQGQSAFVKVAAHPTVVERLRMEHRFYSAVSTDYMPQLLGWDDNGVAPLLAIEDLSDGLASTLDGVPDSLCFRHAGKGQSHESACRTSPHRHLCIEWVVSSRRKSNTLFVSSPLFPALA